MGLYKSLLPHSSKLGLAQLAMFALAVLFIIILEASILNGENKYRFLGFKNEFYMRLVCNTIPLLSTHI